MGRILEDRYGARVTALEVASGIAAGWKAITFEWSPAQSLGGCEDVPGTPGSMSTRRTTKARTALHGAAAQRPHGMLFSSWQITARIRKPTIKAAADTFAGAMKGNDRGFRWTGRAVLVRVGVQSAVAHPETEKLLIALMRERGMNISASAVGSSICLTR